MSRKFISVTSTIKGRSIYNTCMWDSISGTGSWSVFEYDGGVQCLISEDYVWLI